MSATAPPQALIGTDVGGTHTDVAVAFGDRLVRGKALTTHDDYSRGMLAAIEVAAGELDLSLAELLEQTGMLINGTTVVTNSITELRGSRVGVLMTEGFTDTLRIAGGSRLEELDDQLNVPVPDLVPRRAIVGVTERIDWAGDVVVPIDLEQVRESVRRLVEEEGIEALAICFLSSFLNPEHEIKAREVVAELYPDLFVTTSHRVFPIAGETRRFTTAVLNSFVQSRAKVYLESLDAELRGAGLRQGVTYFQGLGGAISMERAKEHPLSLLGSGPAAGAIGANELARRMGRKNVLVGDMGGTSFDTGIIVDNELRVEKNLQLGPFATGVNLVDVVSVGAGGGSIVSVSDRGVPQVGPHSAGSSPGLAAYGQGGEDATVTDALVQLGLIDPERYLGGRVRLRPELAEEALGRTLAEPFGWSVDEAAAAVYSLVVVNMATAMREVSVQKGFDPRDFLFLAYGGTLGLFASDTADHLGISTVVIPRNSPVFCAEGLHAADFVVRVDRGIGWNLGDGGEEIERVNRIAAELVAEVRETIAAEGFAEDQVEILRTADLRFQGQAYELTMPVPDRPLEAADAAVLAGEFHALYERTYGAGTAWEGVATTMVNYSVTATARHSHAQPAPAVAPSEAPSPVPVRDREVFLPETGRRTVVPVYDDEAIGIGASLAGPAVIDAHDTTIFVPSGVTASRDESSNYLLTR